MTTLTTRRLNRALLARQGLLEPWHIGAAEAIERVVGLQSQAPQAAYVALWARLADFDPQELSRLIADRQVVRIALMRSTIFCVTSADCLSLRPVLQPASDRVIASTVAKRTAEIDAGPLLARARQHVERDPLTFAELGELLAAEFTPYAAEDLVARARVGLPLVQVPPRGLWQRSGLSRHTTAQAWLGRALGTATDPDGLVLRYLRAFGPATVADLQVWSGLTGLRAAIARLRPQLRTFRTEHGQELLDVDDGLLPGEDVPAPVRILGEFDNCLLAHADRSRIFDDVHRMRFMTKNGLVRSTVLVDGFVAAVCTTTRTTAGITMTVSPVREISQRQRKSVHREADRMLSFLTKGEQNIVQFDG